MANEVYYNRGTPVDLSAGLTLPANGAANASDLFSITHPAPDEHEIRLAVTPGATPASGETYDVYICTSEAAGANADGDISANDTSISADNLTNCLYAFSVVCDGTTTLQVGSGIARIVSTNYMAILKNSTAATTTSATGFSFEATPIYPQGQ